MFTTYINIPEKIFNVRTCMVGKGCSAISELFIFIKYKIKSRQRHNRWKYFH